MFGFSSRKGIISGGFNLEPLPQKYVHVSKHFCHDTQVMETQLLDAKYLSRTKVNIVSIHVKNTNKQEEKVVLHQRHVQTLA